MSRATTAEPGLFGFPNPVNEIAARVVAAGVFTGSASILVLSLVSGTGWLWWTVVLALGFLARAATGPTLSPLGQLATRVVAPRLGPPRPVPGPPKRFAQAIGAVVTTTAVVLVAVGLFGAAQALLGLMVVFSGLEAFLGLCVGCAVFGLLMRRGLIPAETCAACADVSHRLRAAA